MIPDQALIEHAQNWRRRTRKELMRSGWSRSNTFLSTHPNILRCKKCNRIVARWFIPWDEVNLLEASTMPGRPSFEDLFRPDYRAMEIGLAVPRRYFHPGRTMEQAQKRYLADLNATGTSNHLPFSSSKRPNEVHRRPGWSTKESNLTPAYFEIDWSFPGPEGDPKLRLWCHPKACRREFSVWASKLQAWEMSKAEGVVFRT